MSDPDPVLESHYKLVFEELFDGAVVPVLGAGVNLCGPPEAEDWFAGSKHLPSGGELAAHLAKKFRFPDEADAHDLVRVSQYAEAMTGWGRLYDTLHEIFVGEYRPTPLHVFLARLPKRIAAETGSPRYQLIVTTNYDDALEAAFRDEGEEFDVITYIAEGENRGRFMHHKPDGGQQVIARANVYIELPVDERGRPERTMILKIHGAVDRTKPTWENDSYVITEDDYIEYLTRSDISSLVPPALVAKLKRSQLLFLGYSMRDWNLRVILHRIWGEQKLSGTFAAWAIQLKPDPIEKKFWEQRGVDVFDVSLSDYVAALEELAREAQGAVVGR